MIPLAITLEDDMWHIDVMVKRPSVGGARHVEWDVHAEDTELSVALKGCYKRLGNWRELEREVTAATHRESRFIINRPQLS